MRGVGKSALLAQAAAVLLASSAGAVAAEQRMVFDELPRPRRRGDATVPAPAAVAPRDHRSTKPHDAEAIRKAEEKRARREARNRRNPR